MPNSSSDNSIPSFPALPKHWVIFCAVVDNFGDMGVCWRLAKQLQRQYGCHITLIVDEFDAFMNFVAMAQLSSQDLAIVESITIVRWTEGVTFDSLLAQELGQADIVIEAFACELPRHALEAMAQRGQPPLWINLEYLSAQSWVGEYHGLSSMLSINTSTGASRTLHKSFFFPGFVTGTGGVLREDDIIAQHQHWRSDVSQSRRQWVSDFALDSEQTPIDGQWVSIFSYESIALTGFLESMADSEEPLLCLVPSGRSLASVAEVLGMNSLPQPGSYRKGALLLCVLPFLSQYNYDRLLSLCDFNVVRGEDSFVRAQWAARPFLWHIYPQDEAVHMDKLEAFLDLYAPQDLVNASEHCEVMRRFWRCWNLDEDCSEMWHYLRPQLPRLGMHAVEWRRTMAQRPDLSANLLEFCRQRIGAID